MQIPLEHLLAKMEEELYEAKNAGTKAQLGGSIYAMKTLCELILTMPGDEQNRSVQIDKKISVSEVEKGSPQKLTPLRVDTKIGSGSSDDSLLDF